MKKSEFKEGDWCFCEFKLQQILKIEDGEITGVSDGICTMGGHLNDSCYPLDMKIKQISDGVAFWHKKFHDLSVSSLNHPDLNQALIEKWIEMCENKDNADKLKKLYKRLDEFGKSIIEKVDDIKNEKIEGIKIFR